MNRRGVILLAAVIVVAGVALAVQFRKPKDSITESRGWTATGPAAADVANPVETPPSVVSSTVPSFDRRVESTADVKKPATMSSALAELDRKVFPSGDVPMTTPPVPGGPASTDPIHPRTTTLDVPRPHPPATATSPLVELNGRDQSHRISDGDTLARLAERYLGRADRSHELYEYNRDVLRNPEVLPIGAELRIPPQIPVQAPVEPAGPKAPESGKLDLPPLVPLSGKTAAGLMGVTPARSASVKTTKPRTYRVEVGDNLVDIARKLYGDGRRHEQLFEANRNVLKNPAALKAGMVLVVP